MIEKDIYAHLKSDVILAGLLGGVALDSKIYPLQSKIGSKPPFIVYEVSSPGLAYTDLIEEENIQFNIFHESYKSAGDIELQLKKLLSISDGLLSGASTSIPSSEHYIYSGIVSGSNELRDPDTELYIKIINFSFKYKRK